MTHRDICIEFEVEGRRYKAVGFLTKYELSVSGDEMFSRARAIGKKDEMFLSERRSQFPEELREYYLVTGRRDPEGTRDVSCFFWDVSRWCQVWLDFDDQWHNDQLVLQR